MTEGFYYLKTKDGSEAPILVHGYHCTDAGGAFVYGFNIHDGGGFLRHSDLTENSVVVPISIVESQPAEIEYAAALRVLSEWFDCPERCGLDINDMREWCRKRLNA
jgi:hypothetical protein